MISYAVTFLVISLFAALPGFGGVAGLSYQIGYIFAILAVVFLIVAPVSARRRGLPGEPRFLVYNLGGGATGRGLTP